MITRLVTVVALLIPLVITGCELMQSSENDQYSYVARDTTGDAVVLGTLWLDFTETGDTDYPTDVEGTWRLSAVEDAGPVGSQVGEGRLVGSISDDGDVWINLNPDWEDNNVVLEGAFTAERLGDMEGRWYHSTFAGAVSHGAFTARRR